MITPNDFEQRFQELDFLSACEQSMEVFNDKYEELLNVIKQHSGLRLELALRLKALQIKQGLFLCTLYEMERIREGLPEDVTNTLEASV